MKRNGYIALGLFILSLIIISNIGGPASYGFFFFTLFVPLVSFIYTIIVYIRFKIYQRIDTRTVTAGNATPFFFTLQNEDVFTHSGVQTHFFSDFSSITDLDDEEYELMPHTGISRETLLLCRYRGEYDVGIKSVTVTDHLRLFSITFRNRETIKAIVLPRLELLPDSVSPENVIDPAGSLSRDRKLPDIPVRGYVPGDDISLINWKATARSGKPQVRTFTGEASPACRIFMDSCRYSEKPEDHLPLENKILETVLALTYFLAEHGIGVSIRKDNTQKAFFAACDSDDTITDCSSVIYILHEWSDAARLYSESLGGYSIRQDLYLITDKAAAPVTGSGEHMGCKVIGYEDRISEVLG